MCWGCQSHHAAGEHTSLEAKTSKQNTTAFEALLLLLTPVRCPNVGQDVRADVGAVGEVVSEQVLASSKQRASMRNFDCKGSHVVSNGPGHKGIACSATLDMSSGAPWACSCNMLPRATPDAKRCEMWAARGQQPEGSNRSIAQTRRLL